MLGNPDRQPRSRTLLCCHRRQWRARIQRRQNAQRRRYATTPPCKPWLTRRC
jgi:hypothetical protein